MSTQSYFQTEDDDIVTLSQPGSPDTMHTGWVNVGPHAVKLTYNPISGDLELETYARQQEDAVLSKAYVTGERARAAGGSDPDA